MKGGSWGRVVVTGGDCGRLGKRGGRRGRFGVRGGGGCGRLGVRGGWGRGKKPIGGGLVVMLPVPPVTTMPVPTFTSRAAVRGPLLSDGAAGEGEKKKSGCGQVQNKEETNVNVTE